jgi:predicted transcriptional regulator
MTKSDRSRGQVFYEREKLMRQFERMKSELQTYENNIGFLSSSSKKGNVLLDDMNNKIEKIKAELDLIVKKIDTIDESI